MNSIELQVTIVLCILFFLRMIGMFIIIPVLSHYKFFLKDSNDFLIGIAMGIYGVSQIIFQIPFGILSDKYGRKLFIVFGLILFFLGNAITLILHSTWGLIIGRFIQGSGAISGTLMALLSDFIREKNQKITIFSIGLSFALSFLIAMIVGPLLAQYFGFFSIFWVSSFLSLVCIYVALFFIPNIPCFVASNYINIFNKIVWHYAFSKKFIRYYISIFFIHFFFVINFMIIPKKLEFSGLSLDQHWKVYCITILISFCISFFLRWDFFLKNIIEICIFLFFLANIIFFYFSDSLIYVICAIQIFFISFNILEMFLPSHLSKKVFKPYKGSVMSVYSTSQFLGIFLGGFFNSICFSYLNMNKIFFLESSFLIFWLVISFRYKI